MGTPLWIRPKRMMYSLLLALILVACVFAKDDHARVFGPGKDFGSFEESGTLSSTSSTSSSSTSSSDEDRSRRAERDQRRIELAVQDALLADNPEPAFPQRAQFKSKSYQITYTTVKDSLPDERIGEARSNPVFGPVAIVSYTAPLDGMWDQSALVHKSLVWTIATILVYCSKKFVKLVFWANLNCAHWFKLILRSTCDHQHWSRRAFQSPT